MRTILPGLLAGIFVSEMCLAEVGVVEPRSAGPAPRFGQIIVEVNPPGPDPFLVWSPLIQIDPPFVLNPAGDANGDGAPSFGFGASTSQPPTIAWAKLLAEGNHDPVYAQFVDGAWTEPVFIAQSPGDDLDPRWWQDAGGTIHAVWWRAGSGGAGGQILYASRAPGQGAFSVEEPVSGPGEAARAPSLAVLDSGEVLVAYETDPVNGQRQIVAASKPGLISTFQTEIIGASSEPTGAAPEILARGGHVWVTWIASPSSLGYNERSAGVWSEPPGSEPCTGPDNAGRARLAVQARITSH